MMQTFSKYKWIIIGAVVVILVFVLFAMLKPESKSADGIERTIVSIPGGNGSVASGEDPAAGFILQLLAIKQVNFNTKFFQDPIYLELVDQYTDLNERPVGRPNPFLDIGIDNVVFESTGSSRAAAPAAGTGSAGASTGGGEASGFVQTSPEDNIPQTGGDQ